jgi:hypothetical protein
MDNDAILMPMNDALAIEYQRSYGSAGGDAHVSDIVDDAESHGLMSRHGSSLLVERSGLLFRNGRPIADDVADATLVGQ